MYYPIVSVAATCAKSISKPNQSILAIESVARANNLGFLPYQEEQYDFIVPKSRRDRTAVQAFLALLAADATKRRLTELGFRLLR